MLHPFRVALHRLKHLPALLGRRLRRWVKQQPKEAAALLAPFWGLDAAIVEQANGRRSYAVRAATAQNIAEQQKIADAFFAEKLLPRRVNALDIGLFKPQA